MAVMDATGMGILAVMLSIPFPIFLFLWGRWQKSKLTKAKQWPKTEATIQTGAIEVVAPDLGSAMRLPVFAFSYQVGGEYYSGRFALMPYTGEYYSGRFALMPYTVQYDDSLVNRMIGRKLLICYDSAHPERCLIPDDMIDGYKVKQKMGPHLLDYYPSDTRNGSLTRPGLNDE